LFNVTFRAAAISGEMIMSNKANGGAGFTGFDYYRSKPLPHEAEGMSLRDFLAAKAMQALVTSGLNTDAWEDYDDLSKSAWSIADAMLRARETS